MDFSTLLSPLTTTDFVDGPWERHPARLGPCSAECIAALLRLDDVDRILAEGRLPPALLSFNRGGEAVSPDRYRIQHSAGKDRVVESIDQPRAHALLAEGHTMVMAELQSWHEPVRQLCDSMAQVLAGRVHANVYITPSSCQGFGAHYDSHDVFIVQLVGRKRWRLRGAPHPLPLSGESFTRVAPSVGPVERELVLEPGDVLYLPRGHIHEAAAMDSLSMHTTLGVTVPRWADLVTELIAVASHEDVALRRALLPAMVRTGASADGVETATALWKRLMRPETLAKARARLARRFSPVTPPRTRHRLVDFARTEALDVDMVCGPQPGLAIRRDAAVGTVELRSSTQALVLPEILGEELEYIAGSTRFRVGDLPGELDDEDKLQLTRTLVRGGFVRCYGQPEATP